jgi:peptide/nickel transport system substrate-binding protein
MEGRIILYQTKKKDKDKSPRRREENKMVYLRKMREFLSIVFMFIFIVALGNLVPAYAKAPQVLTVNFRLGASSLDPHLESASSANRELTPIYDRLIVMDSEMKVQPQLAKSWEASKDGRTWILRLRSGVKFHDGTSFNAEAVKFNLERVLNPATGSFYLPDYSVINSMEIVDDLTIKFNLKYPFATFIRNLGLAGGAMVSPTAVNKWGKDFGKYGCGTGPFKVEKYIPKDRIEVVRFNEYWQGPAKLERIVFTNIGDDQARISALLSGGTDFEETVPGQLLPLVQKNPNIVIQRGPALMVEYISFNVEVAPFNDPRVRRAAGYAIDMPAIIKNVYDGIGIHASQVVSPLVFGYDPSIKPYPYDPAKAKQLLVEAGWKDTNNDGILDNQGQPFKTICYAPNMPQQVKFVEAFQSYLKQVGMDISIQILDWGGYVASLKAGKAPMFILGHGSSAGDADAALWVFHSSGIPNSNRARYSNPEFDKLCEEERKEMDPNKRLKLLQKGIKMLVDDAPLIYSFTRESIIAHYKKVKGFKLHPNDYYMDFYPVYIED